MQKLPFIILLLLGMACSSSKKTVDTTSVKNQPTVLTAILSLQTNKNQETNVKLLNIIKAEGHAKITTDKAPNFEFRFVDKKEHTITSIFKQVQLTTVYEYVDDNGNMAKKEMEGEPVILPVRVNFLPSMHKLVVYQMQKENYEPITTFLIQEKTN